MLNGSPINSQELRGLVSYVPQDDYNLLSNLTVRETLYFATELRCSRSVPSNERKGRVEDTIRRFGLESCANTIVGSAFNKGISGGEKRRLSIACETVAEPKVLVLDEPTSGLDSRTALSVLEVLHQLSSDGCTVILSIHQPSSTMWAMLSTCLLLSPDGRPLYAAEADQMLSYFDRLEHTCPHTASPPDFFMDIAAGSSAQEIERLVDKWTQSQFSAVITASDTPTPSHSDLSRPQSKCCRFIPTTRVLLHRAYLSMLRNPLSIFVRLVQCPGMGLIWIIFVAPLHKDYNSIQTRMGLMIQYGPVAFIGMLQNIATFPAERDLFEHESSMNLYGATAFLAQYTAIELPFEIIAAGIFSLLFAYAAQLGPTATKFGVCFLSAVCALNTGESLSMLACLAFGRNLSLAVNCTSALLSIFTMLGGTMSLNPPRVLQWVNHISPIKYAIDNLAYYCLSGLELQCTDSQRRADGSCPLQTGEQALELYGLNTDRPDIGLVAGVVLMVGYRLLVWAVLMLQVRCRNGFGFRRSVNIRERRES
ncbi:uncharacterized protein AKAW2_60949S [Aspergillus luchuensis]|nr:uncharacterized protein AKAW2_60949S [Aspergillus luchuensis]BCS02685.1 hypothetical protein AKAW2_60949S [Aspergillus luchuensis]BCS14344.1 hypothetical protein ALUC_60900S [Aspergillus luchuensis]